MKAQTPPRDSWVTTPPGQPTRLCTLADLIDVAMERGMTPPSDYIFEAPKVTAYLRAIGFALDYAPVVEEEEEEDE